MALWQAPRNKKEQTIADLGEGLNQSVPGFDIGDGEATECLELDSRKWPSLSVRPGRSTNWSHGTTNPQGIGQRGSSDFHEVDDNTWRVAAAGTTSWVNLTTSLSTGASASFLEYVAGLSSTDRHTVMCNGVDKKIYDGTTVGTLGDSNTPATNIIAANAGRLYAASGVFVNYSALNKGATDWTTANDAGSFEVTNAKGPITAMGEYSGQIEIFTEYSMHELYGTGPANFQLVDLPGSIGCISRLTLVKCQSKLYWLAYDGVYEYAGGLPQKISLPVNEEILDINFTKRAIACAGSLGDFLYIAIPQGSSTKNSMVLKFDVRLRKWYKESAAFAYFVRLGNTLYGVDYSGNHWNCRDLTKVGVDDVAQGTGTTAPIAWTWRSKPFQDGSLQGNKTLSEVWFVADIATASTSFAIGYTTQPESTAPTITTLSTVAGSSDTLRQRIQVPTNELQNEAFYRLNVTGAGDATLHQLEKVLRVKPR